MEPDQQHDQQHSQHAMPCQGGRGNLSGPFSPEHTDKEAVIAEAFAVCAGDSLTILLLSSISRQTLLRLHKAEGTLITASSSKPAHAMQALRHALKEGGPIIAVKADHVQQLFDTLKTLQSLLGCQVLIHSSACSGPQISLVCVCKYQSAIRLSLHPCLIQAVQAVVHMQRALGHSLVTRSPS